MAQLHSCREHCPYCGEPIELLVEDVEPEQDYIEDCEVCCRPIGVHVVIGTDGDIRLDLRTDNE